MTTEVPPIDLYTAADCAHCADMKKRLTSLADEKRIAAVNVHDIAHEPMPEAFRFIRSVPVMAISGLPFVGNYKRE